MIPARYRPFAVCVDAMIYENIDITVKKVRLQKNFGKNAQNAAKYLAMSKKSSTFAPSNEKTNKRKDVFMQLPTRPVNHKVYMVSVPQGEARRFKSVVKALGWQWQEPEKLNATTMQAIEELDNGGGIQFDSVNDYLQALG